MTEVKLQTDFQMQEVSATEWNGLANGIPFRSFEWCEAWWRHYGGGSNKLFILTVMENENCIGIAPLYARQGQTGRILRMLGDGEVCSDHLSILALQENGGKVANALADWLVKQSRNARRSDLAAWELMDFDGLDDSCPTLRAFRKALEERGVLVRASSVVHTWRLSLPSVMDDYIAPLSKSSRRNVRAALRRLKNDQHQLIVADDCESFDECWAHLVYLHQRRRKSLGQAGCFSSDQFRRFLLDIAKTFLESDQLELLIIRNVTTSLAAQICLRGAKDTFVYQVGMNPDELSQSPGWLANAALIQSAIAQGQAGLDWCRGDEDYKKRLGAIPKHCLQWRVVPPRLSSRLWDVAILGSTRVKGILRRGLVATGLRP